MACDFKCGFDRDDPLWQRLNLPAHLFAVDFSDPGDKWIGCIAGALSKRDYVEKLERAKS